MTEQQPYTVVGEYDGFELREYPPYTVAEVCLDATFEQAGNAAFRPLFAYISGANRASSSIAMTAPVVQSQRIAMTAPVVQHADAAGAQVVAFVLPAGLTAESAPQPTDPRVAVATRPGGLTAVARYSGRWSLSAYHQHVDGLLADVAAAGLVAVGPPRFARFDPPFKPWFLRRNEVHGDVRKP